MRVVVTDINGNNFEQSQNIIIDNFKPQIKEFEVQGLGAGLDEVAKIGDTVRVRMRFDQEMDPDYYPELRTKDGTQSIGNVMGQWWEEGPDGVTDTFVTDIELSELDSQQFMKLEVSVSNAKGLGPPERDVSDQLVTLDDGQTPLVIWADLVRPVGGVEVWDGPETECGKLYVEADIRDEPRYYQPGEEIPEAERFRRMALVVLEEEAGATSTSARRGFTALRGRYGCVPSGICILPASRCS
ncbi:MAG: hypothetical protein D6806_03175 [Deltaproteobacteria bacterium]|nr:MAG: hypothetical protein D6806_03175 [Deltaproteobacteria bacterium]